MLYVDIPTQQDIRQLNAVRDEACVSLYLPTTPLTQEASMNRIELGHLAEEAFSQLQERGFDKRRLADMRALIDPLLEDEGFWRFQANSLAVLLTPSDIRTFRLPNRLQRSIEVSDRFHLKPLLRAVTFPHVAFVLALSENSVRLVEVSPDMPPHPVPVEDMPRDAASALDKPTLNSRGFDRRIHGSEGQKVRLAQFARKVDTAIRPTLAGLEVPLILAAAEPLASIYRSVNSYPQLMLDIITNTNDRSSEAELAAAARPVLDLHYEHELARLRQRFEDRAGSGRAYTDLSDIARAVTFGAVEALLVDIDIHLPGSMDEETGALHLVDEPNAAHYDVLDEIAGRALVTGARVLAVRSADIPGPGQAAAILRYAV